MAASPPAVPGAAAAAGEGRWLAGDSVRGHVRLLRVVGFCRLPPAADQVSAADKTPADAATAADGAVTHRRLHTAYCFFALATTSGYVMQQAVYAYQERRDMAKLSRVLFVLLCHVTCVAKQLVFHLDARRVHRLVASLSEEVFAPRGAAARRLLAGTAAAAARLQRAFAACGVATCVLWGALPALSRLRGRRVELPFWTPLDYDRPLQFVIVMLHSFYATNLVAVGNTTMDAFIATVLYQCQSQLRILRMNFENLPERAREITAGRSVASYEDTLMKLFIDCIRHFQKINETMELLESVFGLAVLLQFTVGGWILCMAAYKIVSVSVLSFEFASTTLFIVCILVELFLYCYYGNEVTVESERVLQSLYGMEWLHTPLRFKRSLLLTMERSQRLLRPAAGYIIPLSLDTFVTIMRSSYSFYAVLRQTK